LKDLLKSALFKFQSFGHYVIIIIKWWTLNVNLIYTMMPDM